MDEWKQWTISELERQVSPSRWHPERDEDEVMTRFFRVLTEETEKAKEQIPHKLDISYGPKPKQKYDVYGTDLPENAVIFFFIHGGYWQEGTKDFSATMAKTLFDIGVRTIVTGYTLAPEVTVDEIQQEIYSALKHVLGVYKESKIIVGGHSCGGQLASSLLHVTKGLDEIQNRLAGLALFSGVFDLRPLVPTYINDALRMTNEDAEKVSSLLLPFISTKLVKNLPILVCVGEHEPDEFKRQSFQYRDKLEKSFSNVHYWISEEDDHFTIIEKLAILSENSSGQRFRDFVKDAIK